MKSGKKLDIDKVFGEIFKEYRIKNRLTQEKLAEKLEISVKYISRIENGTGGVKVETLVNYMNVLGISPNVIFEPFLNNPNLKLQLDLSKKASKLNNNDLKLIIGIIDLLLHKKN